MGHIHKPQDLRSNRCPSSHWSEPLCHLTSNPHESNILISDLAVYLQGGKCSKVKYSPFHPIQLEMRQHKDCCHVM